MEHTKEIKGIEYLELLVKYHQLLVVFYDLLAEKETGNAVLWKQMAAGKQDEMAALQGLRDGVHNDQASIAMTRTPAPELLMATAALENRIQSWCHWGMTEQAAMEYSMMIERSLVEEDFYLPLRGDSTETVDVLHSLWDEAERNLDHLQRTGRRRTKKGWLFRIVSSVIGLLTMGTHAATIAKGHA